MTEKSTIALRFMELLVAEQPGEHPIVTAVMAFDLADAYEDQRRQREEKEIDTSAILPSVFINFFKSPSQSSNEFLTIKEICDILPANVATAGKVQLHLKRQGYENKLFKSPDNRGVRKYKISLTDDASRKPYSV